MRLQKHTQPSFCYMRKSQGLFLFQFLQIQFLKKIAEICSDILGFWYFHFFFRFFLDLFQRFHAETDLSIFDSNDLNIYFIPCIQHIFWGFYTLLADLRNMYQSGQAIFQADESAVGLQTFYCSFYYAADFDIGDLFFHGFLFFFF